MPLDTRPHAPERPPHRSPASGGRGGGLAAQTPTLRILRAFLGGTFLYAGVQKLADPTFLRAGSPGSIQSQLSEFAHGSPIRPLITAMGHAPVLVGVAVALVEVAIGIATLTGVAPVTAALAGLAINVLLWLSATWHVHPYFLGSDSIYAVAWGAYLAGVARPAPAAAGPCPRRDPAALVRDRRPIRAAGACSAARPWPPGRCWWRPCRRTAAGDRAGPGRRSPPVAGHPASRAPVARPGPHPAPARPRRLRRDPDRRTRPDPRRRGDRIPGPAGGPAILVRTGPESVAAFSRVCTHAGCLVGYDSALRADRVPVSRRGVRPPSRRRVVAGPAPAALPEVPVTVDRGTGQVLRQD